MTDHRPRVLIELGAELERAATTALSLKPSRLRSLVRGPRPFVAVAGLAAATILAIVLISAGTQVRSPTGASPKPRALGLEAAFVVLRRPARAADRLPPVVARDVQDDPEYVHSGLQLDHTRLIITTRQVHVWMIPGSNRQVCLAGENKHRLPGEPAFDMLCNAYAVSGGAVGGFGDTIVGIVPDGSRDVEVVRRGGRATPLVLTDGAFAFPHTPGKLPIDVYFTEPTGKRTRFHIAWPWGIHSLAQSLARLRSGLRH